MSRVAVAAAAAIGILAAGLAGLAGCGAAATDVRAPARVLPPYGAHEAELFDDAIEAEAVGTVLATPADNELLRQRALQGDAVVRARVTTITSQVVDKGEGWQMGFHTVERLAGDGPLATDFVVQVEPTGPAAGMLRAYEGTLVGQTFIAFAREYARPGAPGESDLHFHLAQDGKAGVDAVREAVILQKVR